MSDPKVAARELGVELRNLRLRSGMSGQRLAVEIGCSQSKISKLETGRLRPNPEDVRAITSALDASDDTVRRLVQRAEQVSRGYEDWRLRQREGLTTAQHEFKELEESVTTIRLFQPGLVPGLLQTPEYAAHILTRPGRSGEDIVKGVAARLERQLILQDIDKQLHFVVPESALRARLAPPIIMRVQLERLLSVSALPNVSLAIVPAIARLPRPPLHGFCILGDALVVFETFDDFHHVDDPGRVQVYVQVFEAFRAVAVTGTEARVLIESIIADIQT